MSQSVQQLISSALQLPASDRAEVVDAILASLQPSIDEGSAAEIQDAWSSEIRSRISDIESGRVTPIPSAEAWKMIDGEAELSD